MQDEQYARIAVRLLEAVQQWADDAGVPRSELAIMLASAAAEIASQEESDLTAGVELLRSVADTLDGYASSDQPQNAGLRLLRKLGVWR